MVGGQSFVQGVVVQRLHNHGVVRTEAHNVMVVVMDNLVVVDTVAVVMDNHVVADTVAVTPHTAQNVYLAVIGCAATTPC